MPKNEAHADRIGNGKIGDIQTSSVAETKKLEK